ncbi:MAG: hypothetical protein IPO90_15700 [Flavobacteriales bacterium]|nr:hypothetical protein [Flavobacteriales bacterium]
MFLRNELNVELSQLNGTPGSTGGLCAGQPITSLAIYIGANAGLTVAPTPAGPSQKPIPAGLMCVTIKHVAFGLNDLSAGFNNVIDPAQACYLQAPATNRPTVQNAWETFTTSTPFVWDGVRNVVVEFAYATAGAAAPPPVLCASTGAALLTASWNSAIGAGACGTCWWAQEPVARWLLEQVWVMGHALAVRLELPEELPPSARSYASTAL